MENTELLPPFHRLENVAFLKRIFYSITNIPNFYFCKLQNIEKIILLHSQLGTIALGNRWDDVIIIYFKLSLKVSYLG